MAEAGSDSKSTLDAALKAADDACEALGSDDSLRQPMVALLVLIKARLQQDDRGGKPSLPDRGRYLNKLAESNPRRPLRARAYAALDAILAIGWRPMTCTERTQRRRQDEAKRRADLELDNERRRQRRADELAEQQLLAEEQAEKHRKALQQAADEAWRKRRAAEQDAPKQAVTLARSNMWLARWGHEWCSAHSDEDKWHREDEERHGPAGWTDQMNTRPIQSIPIEVEKSDGPFYYDGDDGIYYEGTMKHYEGLGGSYVGEFRDRERVTQRCRSCTLAAKGEQSTAFYCICVGAVGDDGERWKPALRDGWGTYTFVSGDVYAGNWSKGCMHGYGEMTFADGGYLKGDWHFNECLEGLRKWPNGDYYDGRFRLAYDDKHVPAELSVPVRCTFAPCILCVRGGVRPPNPPHLHTRSMHPLCALRECTSLKWCAVATAKWIGPTAKVFALASLATPFVATGPMIYHRPILAFYHRVGTLTLLVAFSQFGIAGANLFTPTAMSTKANCWLERSTGVAT